MYEEPEGVKGAYDADYRNLFGATHPFNGNDPCNPILSEQGEENSSSSGVQSVQASLDPQISAGQSTLISRLAPLVVLAVFLSTTNMF